MEDQDNSRNEVRERLKALRELIREGEASTQEELCEALALKGFEVNQSTVSRDLRKIGAIKVTNAEEEIVYILPEDQRGIPMRVMHTLEGLLTEIVANETMIVVHTAPGAANLVARHLDNLRDSLGILGTIAGDDTIMVIPESIKKIASVKRKIKEELD